jgi:polyvinyl alcohol dehydrogenase (cytochrome)
MWAALDPGTGALLWQTPDPSSTRPLVGFYANLAWGLGKGPGFFAAAMGPLTVANGVLFGGSMDPEGHMYAFDAKSGAILWSFASGGSVMSAPAVVDGVVYWGSGYRTGFDANKMYAFALPN